MTICISATCSISHGIVLKDGKVIYRSAELNVQSILQDVYKQSEINYPRFYKMDNLSKLGWLTSELLLRGFNSEEYAFQQTGIVFANANSSIDSDLRYFDSVGDIPSPALFVYTLPNIMIGEIAIRNKFKGETAFFVSEQFDALFLESYVTDLFVFTGIKRCLCGWVDILADHYKSVLYLVEMGEEKLPFNAYNLNLTFDKA